MKILAPFAVVALSLLSNFAHCADFPLVDAIESRPREGLPNLWSKLQTQGSEIKVAYLGGSITAQAGWRPKSLAFLQSTFPGTKFAEINAAIGGTGSDLGVFRLRQDVLDRSPDLLFVEFAVNDSAADPQQILRCMEGIVRQTWRALPKCDICFVYTLTEATHPAMLEGKFPRAASVMEKVADHYGIPTIQLGMEVAKLAKEGRLIWSAPLPKTDAEKQALGEKVVFAPDSVHPHPETGHELYLKAIQRSWPAIQTASGKAQPHLLGAPLIETNYEQAKLLPIQDLTLSPGVLAMDPQKDPIAKQFSQRLPALHRGSKAGDSISFKFKGTRAAIYDLLGPDAGQVSVTLDDQPPRVISRFDSYCTYHRLGAVLIGSELPDTLHTVKIEIHPDSPKKAEILAQRKNSIDKPERFEGTAFYPGALMLVGELVK